MSKEKRDAPPSKDTSLPKFDSPQIIASRNESVNFDELKANGITARAIVDTVREIYPKYDKYLHSKVINGDIYGIQLRSEAISAIDDRFYQRSELEPTRAIATGSNRTSALPDYHIFKKKVQCRLSDVDFEDFRRYIKEDGYDTMQTWLKVFITQYLKRKRKADGQIE